MLLRGARSGADSRRKERGELCEGRRQRGEKGIPGIEKWERVRLGHRGPGAGEDSGPRTPFLTFSKFPSPLGSIIRKLSHLEVLGTAQDFVLSAFCSKVVLQK